MHVWDDVRGHFTTKFKKPGYVPNAHGKFTSIYGERMGKIYKWGKKDKDDVYESNVRDEVAYILENYLQESDPSTKHKVLFYDIEVAKEGSWSTPDEAANTITSICAYDNKHERYIVWVLSKEGDSIRKTDAAHTIMCADEKTLLTKFLSYWRGVSPTIITGWNIDYFDTPYLYNRLKRLFGVDTADSLSPIGISNKRDDDSMIKLAGIANLDYMWLYKKFNYSEESSYKLDSISKKVLGRGKIEYEGSLDDLMANDFEKFVEYNRVDVELIVDMDKKLEFIELAKVITASSHAPLNFIMHTSWYLDAAILTHCKRQNIVLMNKVKSSRSGTAVGAFVKPPQVGLYDWVYDLDLASLYPSIMRTNNISPETKCGYVVLSGTDGFDEKVYAKSLKTDDVKFDISIFGVGRESKSASSISATQLRGILQKYNYSVSSNGMLYDMNKDGMIPEIMTLWADERTSFKNSMKDAKRSKDSEMTSYYNLRQLMKKVMMNSVYGTLLLSSFRMYDKDNGEAVTTTGQSIIQFTADVSNKEYSKMLYKIRVTLDDGRGGYLLETDEVYCDEKKLAKNLQVGDKIVKFVRGEYCVDVNAKVLSIGQRVDNDYVLYTDTDSCFYSALPLMESEKPFFTIDSLGGMTPTCDLVVNLASKIEDTINKAYDVYCRVYRNVDGEHHLVIKQENVAERGVFIAKKRYAQMLKYEEHVPVDKMDVKGLDVVRSDFPPLLKGFLKEALVSILEGKDVTYVNGLYTELVKSVDVADVNDIMKPTGVKGFDKYDNDVRDKFQFLKGTPIHVKSALTYNDLLRLFGRDDITPIYNGDKVRWIKLIQNPYGLATLAIPNDEDAPNEILDILEKYVDRRSIISSLLDNKLNDIYKVLGWGVATADESKDEEFNDYFDF